MIHIEADKSANLLRIVFLQRVTPAEAKSYEEKVKTSLSELQPGFRLLADLSGLESMDLDCAPYVERAMDQCNQRGVSKVVRVIPDPRKDIGLNIMSQFHYRRHIPIVVCETLAEAMKALAD